MDYRNVPNKYRPIPFWSWNDKLESQEIVYQVQKMRDAGIGGFFMHARGGLQTEYMGEEWFDHIATATEEGALYGMGAWAYDENGWPSGFGNDLVNALGIEYQQKFLRMETECKHTETQIGKSGKHWFYYDVNPFYVDVLDKKVIRAFIEKIYEPYYERFGNKLEGFFTDEPQIAKEGIPWSFVFEEEYRKRYQDDIKNHLEELFINQGDYVTTRFRFWKMVTDLFSSAYMKQIYDWCEQHGLKLTGHLLREENMMIQLPVNGACMPHYEYFHIPGMDWLGRDIFDCLTAKQVSSVAEQLGMEQVISETYALCGHNISFDELKGIYEWQMVRGINLLCQHLEGYSMRGIRKRDYPPAMFIQQPWWDDYKVFVDAVSREGMLLARGKKECSVLLLHPQTKAWTLYNGSDATEIEELNQQLLDAMKTLEKKHVSYHLGDETIMERHAYVENGCIVIGKQRYTQVCMVQNEVLFDSTRKILEEFAEQGGVLTTVEEIEEVLVVDSERITYAMSEWDECKVHFFVNSSRDTIETRMFVKGKKLDITTGDLVEFDGTHKFAPFGSVMIIEEKAKEPEYVFLNREMVIRNASLNALTLDKCDYYFDGVLQEKNGYVLNIADRANTLNCPVQIHQDYHFTVTHVPETLYLVCETPEIFQIKVNDQLLEEAPETYFYDKSFQGISIASLIQKGDNIISFDCSFRQSEEVYENIEKAIIFDSARNKLCYDMEIEPVYLIGDFGVNTPGKWIELERNADRYEGIFEIGKKADKVSPAHLQRQGFPFFSGSLQLEGCIYVENAENAVLKLNRKGVNVLKIEIGGVEKTFLWDADEIPLAGWAKNGENDISITITNNLRNLVGPHHMREGESYAVRPKAFFKEPKVWRVGIPQTWDGNYCLVSFGI